MDHGYPLDWCNRFERECGKPAADAYCLSKGYDQASTFAKRRSEKKTLCIGDHALCDPSLHGCDTFDWIYCKSSKYEDPTEHGNALDWCYRFERECGMPAADAFCRSKGHQQATAFPKRRSSESTRTIGDHATCDPNYHVCDTFDYIKCR